MRDSGENAGQSKCPNPKDFVQEFSTKRAPAALSGARSRVSAPSHRPPLVPGKEIPRMSQSRLASNRANAQPLCWPAHRGRQETIVFERLPPRPHRPNRHPHPGRPSRLPKALRRHPRRSKSRRRPGNHPRPVHRRGLPAPGPSKTPSSPSAFKTTPTSPPATPRSTPPSPKAAPGSNRPATSSSLPPTNSASAAPSKRTQPSFERSKPRAKRRRASGRESPPPRPARRIRRPARPQL